MSKTIDFEKSLKRLEKIVSELEKGGLSLDLAIKHYEEGIRLATACSNVLGEAKTKIEKLTQKDSLLSTEKLHLGEEDAA